MCELIGSEPVIPCVFDCMVPMSVPLKSGEEPINNSGDVLSSQDSLSTEQSTCTSDDRKLSVHHENISQTKPRYPPRERRRPQRLIEQLYMYKFKCDLILMLEIFSLIYRTNL